MSQPASSDPAQPPVAGEKIALSVVGALYLTSLFLHAAIDPSGASHVAGYQVLFTAWAGVIFGNLEWLANPLLMGGLLAYKFRKYQVAGALAGFAVLVACQSFFGFDGHQYFPSYAARQLELGFYVWLIALIVFAAWVANVAAPDAQEEQR